MSDSNNQQDITGKKIFFLYPTASVINQVITELVQNEYEVYISKDHKRLIRAIKKYKDSILYINIDEGMSEAEWEKWVHTINSSLPEIKIGIMTSSTNTENKAKYVEKLRIQCGYMIQKFDMSDTATRILETMNILNVKGRRKYLRATTERETNATLNMPLHGDFVNADIKDISVVGISCAFKDDPDLKKNALIKDIQIRLQSMLLKAEAVVFGSRTDNHGKNYVLLFTQRIDPDVRVKIRKYIQQNLQSKLDNEIL
jgi:hypothetical protein